MSQRPDKRVVAGWELTAPLLLVGCVPNLFMYLSLILTVILLLAKSATAAADNRKRGIRRFAFQFFSNITTDPSQECYEKRYEK
jgi:hypothetical protein